MLTEIMQFENKNMLESKLKAAVDKIRDEEESKSIFLSNRSFSALTYQFLPFLREK